MPGPRPTRTRRRPVARRATVQGRRCRRLPSPKRLARPLGLAPGLRCVQAARRRKEVLERAGAPPQLPREWRQRARSRHLSRKRARCEHQSRVQAPRQCEHHLRPAPAVTTQPCERPCQEQPVARPWCPPQSHQTGSQEERKVARRRLERLPTQTRPMTAQAVRARYPYLLTRRADVGREVA